MIFVLSGSALAKVTISIYNANPAGSGLTNTQQELIDEFMELYPDIEVEHVYNAGYEPAMEKALVAWAADMAPNVIILEQSRWMTWAVEGYIYPLDGFIEQDDSIDLDDF